MAARGYRDDGVSLLGGEEGGVSVMEQARSLTSSFGFGRFSVSVWSSCRDRGENLNRFCLLRYVAVVDALVLG